ncbi:MAG: hypothetical protein J6Y62_03960 [Clostridia bacterium]|nr:hypothetical protein [Clostridia bacterium]
MEKGRIIQRLMELLDFDPGRRRFNYRQACLDSSVRRLIGFLEEWDQEGDLSLVYLDRFCRNLMKDLWVTVEAVVEGDPEIARFREMRGLLNSEEVKGARGSLMDSCRALLAAMGGTRLIGEGLDQAVDSSVAAVAEGMKKLGSAEIYMDSGRPVEIGKVCPKILSFRTLSECLLALEAGPDRACLCHIAAKGLDGWFGWFVKSNGSLFSLNDRVDEMYVGQHANFRNGRAVAEAKALSLFPYEEACRFEGEDYKGYAVNVSIDENSLDIFDPVKMGAAVGLRMLLCLYLIGRKYAGRPVEGRHVYVDSLMPKNISRLGEGCQALVKASDSALVKANGALSISFDRGKFLSNGYQKDFCASSGRRHSGFFGSRNADMVKAYGQDFEFSEDDLLATDANRKLIGEGEASMEFVGDRDRMELQAYYGLRKKLAMHIQKKSQEEYEAFGGKKGMWEWTRAVMAEKFDQIAPKVYVMCVDVSKKMDPGKKGSKASLKFDRSSTAEKTISIPWGRAGITVKGTVMQGRPFCGWDVLSKEAPFRRRNPFTMHNRPFNGMGSGVLKCPVTGAAASCCFEVFFDTLKDVEEFLTAKTPQFCTGWAYDKVTDGNSILDVVDPVAGLVSPLSRTWGDRFDFSFELYLSRSGLNKLEKTYPHVMEEKEEMPPPVDLWGL